WATRFYGRTRLPPLVDALGRPTRFALSAHVWGEPVPRTEAAARRIAAKGRRLLAAAKKRATRGAAARTAVPTIVHRAMAGRKSRSVRRGDHVEWTPSQGATRGVVTRKVVRPAKAAGHTAKASAAEPQFEVKSDKSGKSAIHKPRSLRTTGRDGGTKR